MLKSSSKKSCNIYKKMLKISNAYLNIHKCSLYSGYHARKAFFFAQCGEHKHLHHLSKKVKVPKFIFDKNTNLSWKPVCLLSSKSIAISARILEFSGVLARLLTSFRRDDNMMSQHSSFFSFPQAGKRTFPRCLLFRYSWWLYQPLYFLWLCLCS